MQKHISTFLVNDEVNQFDYIKDYYSGKINVSVSAVIKMLIKEEYKRLIANKDNNVI